MSEEELNEELGALEAVLASFDPPPLGVDRDRVMFLAGQASVAGKAGAGRALGVGWIWPGALAGMTAVAATLLVILLVQSRGRIARETPPDRRPAETVGRDAAEPPGAAKPAWDDQQEARPAVRQPALAAAGMAAFGRLEADVQRRLDSKAEYDRVIEQIALHGFDAREPGVGTSDRPGGPAAPSASYREWLERFRSEREYGKPVTDWNIFAPQRGSKS
jgi:hypothetical protein